MGKINTAVKILILLGFSAFSAWLVISGETTRYVHPRMIPYIIAAAAVMFIIALIMAVDFMRKKTDKKLNASLIIYIIPIITAFSVPAVAFSAADTSTAGLQLGTNTSQQAEAATENTAGTTTVASSETEETTSSQPTETTAESKETAENGSIVLDNANFYGYLYDIYASPEDYTGKEIELTAFVFFDGSVNENEFVAARLVMVCCAADMATSGFLCEYEKSSELEADTWVTVRGTLGVKNSQGTNIPYIIVSSVEKTDAPSEEYIYPY